MCVFVHAHVWVGGGWMSTNFLAVLIIPTRASKMFAVSSNSLPNLIVTCATIATNANETNICMREIEKEKEIERLVGYGVYMNQCAVSKRIIQ